MGIFSAIRLPLLLLIFMIIAAQGVVFAADIGTIIPHSDGATDLSSPTIITSVDISKETCEDRKNRLRDLFGGAVADGRCVNGFCEDGVRVNAASYILKMQGDHLLGGKCLKGMCKGAPRHSLFEDNMWTIGQMYPQVFINHPEYWPSDMTEPDPLGCYVQHNLSVPNDNTPPKPSITESPPAPPDPPVNGPPPVTPDNDSPFPFTLLLIVALILAVLVALLLRKGPKKRPSPSKTPKRRPSRSNGSKKGGSGPPPRPGSGPPPDSSKSRSVEQEAKRFGDAKARPSLEDIAQEAEKNYKPDSPGSTEPKNEEKVKEDRIRDYIVRHRANRQCEWCAGKSNAYTGKLQNRKSNLIQIRPSAGYIISNVIFLCSDCRARVKPRGADRLLKQDLIDIVKDLNEQHDHHYYKNKKR